jgi:hypothetical protein
MPLCQLEDWNSLILTGGGLLDEDADARANRKKSWQENVLHGVDPAIGVEPVL